MKVKPSEIDYEDDRDDIDIEKLQAGSIIRHVATGEAWIVLRKDSLDTAIAVRTIHVSNPREWVLINPKTGQPEEE